MDWFRKQVSPRLRENDSEKEVEEAREKAKESGQASVFEYEDVGTGALDGTTPIVPSAKALAKKKAPEVGFTSVFSLLSSNKLRFPSIIFLCYTQPTNIAIYSIVLKLRSFLSRTGS